VELLDLGQLVFWQQASSLRHDLETLREEEPDLAKSLEEIGRQLDAGNFSVSTIPIGEQLSGNEHHSQWDVGRGRRDLVGIWEGLLERVRQLPKFEHFLSAYEQFMAIGAGRVSFLDNHDMNRFLFVAGDRVELLKLAALCQFTLEPVPAIYYGTEVGMSQRVDAAMWGSVLSERSVKGVMYAARRHFASCCCITGPFFGTSSIVEQYF